MIPYKTKRTQTVVSQSAHSFNQRARDSSSLERTKNPRRIVRFIVDFSFCTPLARFLHARCMVRIFRVGLAAVILAQLCAETDGRYAVTGVVLGGQDMSSLVERLGFTAKGPTHRHWSACRAYLRFEGKLPGNHCVTGASSYTRSNCARRAADRWWLMRISVRSGLVSRLFSTRSAFF